MTLIQTGFNKGQKELWKSFAKQVGGEIIEGGKYNPDSLVYKHRVWTVVLDELVRMAKGAVNGALVTRLRIPIVNRFGFRFKVHKEDQFMKVFKLFGSQDIQMGDPQFDEKFIIEGNHVEMVKHILSDEIIKESLLMMPNAMFTLRTDEEMYGDQFPEGIDLLEIDILGKINTLGSLTAMHHILTRTCEALESFDLSFATDPQVKLI